MSKKHPGVTDGARSTGSNTRTGAGFSRFESPGLASAQAFFACKFSLQNVLLRAFKSTVGEIVGSAGLNRLNRVFKSNLSPELIQVHSRGFGFMRSTIIQARSVCKTFMQGFESPPRLHSLVQFCSHLFLSPMSVSGSVE